MTKEKWGCLFFGCIAAILLSPLIWPYLEPVFGPKPVAETTAIENAEAHLTETYPTLTYSIENCWYDGDLQLRGEYATYGGGIIAVANGG